MTARSVAPYLSVRPFQPDDHNFVLATWLQNYRRESTFARRITDLVYFGYHHDLLKKLMQRSAILVACQRDEPDELAGYIVWEPAKDQAPAALHWVYVKKAMRRWGIGRILLDSSELPEGLNGVEITHPTALWWGHKERPGLEAKFPGAIYNPYRIFMPNDK